MNHLDLISELNPEALKADGFDDCIIGIVDDFGTHRLLYSKWAMMQKADQEYLEFNVWGSYVGENGPLYLEDIP